MERNMECDNVGLGTRDRTNDLLHGSNQRPVASQRACRFPLTLLLFDHTEFRRDWLQNFMEDPSLYRTSSPWPPWPPCPPPPPCAAAGLIAGAGSFSSGISYSLSSLVFSSCNCDIWTNWILSELLNTQKENSIAIIHPFRIHHTNIHHIRSCFALFTFTSGFIHIHHMQVLSHHIPIHHNHAGPRIHHMQCKCELLMEPSRNSHVVELSLFQCPGCNHSQAAGPCMCSCSSANMHDPEVRDEGSGHP